MEAPWNIMPEERAIIFQCSRLTFSHLLPPVTRDIPTILAIRDRDSTYQYQSREERETHWNRRNPETDDTQKRVGHLMEIPELFLLAPLLFDVRVDN